MFVHRLSINPSLSNLNKSKMATVSASSVALILKKAPVSDDFRRGVPSEAVFFSASKKRERFPCCGVAIKSDPLTVDSVLDTDVSAEETYQDKIGAKIRVSEHVKVYHVPKVPEIDLFGLEGEIKQYVGIWKGKRISANLPFKIQFLADLPGIGNVKFFAHLKEEEFEYVLD